MEIVADKMHNAFYERMRENVEREMSDLVHEHVHSELGMKKALKMARKYGDCDDKVEADILMMKWIHAHNELKERT